jgi:cytochrome c-type biogenesis protein CcmF
MGAIGSNVLPGVLTMHDIGTALLYVAFVATLATGLTGLAGAWLRSPGLLAAARHGLVGSWLVFLAMGAALIYGLVTHDFDNKYIAAYTDSDMPMAYLLAGFWGGEKGALLFWTTSLTTFSVWAVLRNRSQSQVFLGYVTSFLALAAFFFVVLMVFESNPFETFLAGAGPDDGKGMNPLLQNPLMAIHPPSLLTGYIAFTVPYAFGLAALVTGQLDSQWLRDTRTWTLVSWLFLSLGLILGGAWAYEELGWGGFWMWDPVENAGLIPWFTATAFLHSVMIQERRNMLKRWNAVLVCLTFLLTIFGTFLTRSQLIDSVHSFADSTIAVYFLWYMAFIASFRSQPLRGDGRRCGPTPSSTA